LQFLIADTFSDSLGRLNADEQKAVKTTAFDLQMDPSRPGLSFHRLDRAKDKRFWSVRVSSDLRLIVHRTDESVLLCYVDHHDRAYEWAERRKLETHPVTGAAQWVEIRETVKEIVVPVYLREERPAAPKPALFEGRSREELLGFGVPDEWLDDVLRADEDLLLALADRLPAEAAEALLELATGGTPRVPPALPAVEPFAHPDALRRFRVMSNVEELERALAAPWEKWTVFLHPEQRDWVHREFGGPARVSGSAGTGKTIVALHRAVHLARTHPEARVLLTTYSDSLRRNLRARLRHLVGNEPRMAEQIEVHSLPSLGLRLHRAQLGPAEIATTEQVAALLAEASAFVEGLGFSLRFLRAEWDQVVDAWQLDTWEAYRDVARLGRKTRLPESRRAALWSVFAQRRTALRERGLMTQAQVFTALARRFASGGPSPFDFAIVDEAQDLGVSELRFFAALGRDRPDALFFAADLGQRIFQQPLSWLSLGVDIRGRSRTLRVNYRTSHQIREQADRLLGPETTDVDGETQDRRHTVSVFNGPAPEIHGFEHDGAESAAVGAWLREVAEEGVPAEEIGIFVRSEGELPRAEYAADHAGLPYCVLDHAIEDARGKVTIGTMHLAKGLEFRAVAVMACDDEVVPLQARVEEVGDAGDLQDVYDTERQLLYVACTRARDRLWVSGVEPTSEFLEDMGSIPPAES
jgi:hypothetical protein